MESIFDCYLWSKSTKMNKDILASSRAFFLKNPWAWALRLCAQWLAQRLIYLPFYLFFWYKTFLFQILRFHIFHFKFSFLLCSMLCLFFIRFFGLTLLQVLAIWSGVKLCCVLNFWLTEVFCILYKSNRPNFVALAFWVLTWVATSCDFQWWFEQSANVMMIEVKSKSQLM